MFVWQYVSLLLLIIPIYGAQRCDEFTDLDLHHSIIGTDLKVRLLLYTRADETCGKLLSHFNPVVNPNFNLSRTTTFIIHGYRPSGSPPNWIGRFTQLLLARKDMNVVVVDWNYGATNLNYFKVVENVRQAAANLTDFVKIMQEHGASLNSIHMIGVSLGGHMAGFVGAKLNGKMGQITALDPAGPKFTGTAPEDRLDPTDAQFVDAIHTDMDSLGFREPVGHIDFYPNGGADQPGCPKTILSGEAYIKCDHQRSVFLYLDSLNRTCDITAFPCSSYVDFMDGRCLNCEKFSPAGCPVFGYEVTKWKKTLVGLPQTKAFFTTNTGSPFCRTNYRLDILTWNQETRWGYITIKLYGDGKEAEATINHKASKFKKYTETRLFAQFDKDLQSVQKVSIRFFTGNVFKPKYKLRVLRVRLKPLERNERTLCRYDVVLEENKETTFRPIPCEEEGNF